MAKKGEETKERILEAAVSLFYEKGYAGATTAEIAKKASISEATIFKYFKKKMDLLHETVLRSTQLFFNQKASEGLVKLMKKHENSSFEEVLKELAMDRINLVEEHWMILRIILTEMQYHEDIKNVYQEKFVENIKELIVWLMGKGEKEGYGKIEDGIRNMRNFIGMIFACIIQRKILENIIPNNKSIEEEVESIIKIYLHGMGGK